MTIHQPIETRDAVHRGLAGVTFDESRITDIQGQHGRLSHRGYSIEQLAAAADFERTVSLLIAGEWPNKKEAEAFRADLARRRTLPDEAIRLIGAMKGQPIDDVLRSAVSILDLGQRDGRDAREIGLDLIAKVPSIIAVHEDIRCGRAPSEPDPKRPLGEDLLRRLLARDLTEDEKQVIDFDLVLHADHGANASTFTGRVVASAGADMVAAVTAAIAAFCGPLHGGAVSKAGAMQESIAAPEDAAALVADRRRRKLPVYGFGHRVYRTRDPRSVFYEQAASRLARSAEDKRRLAVAQAIAEAMAPMRRMGIDINVDFYTVLTYRMLGLPSDLGTALYAAGRTAGWIAQILEQQANNILIRPRLRYTGPHARSLPGGG